MELDYWEYSSDHSEALVILFQISQKSSNNIIP